MGKASGKSFKTCREKPSADIRDMNKNPLGMTKRHAEGILGLQKTGLTKSIVRGCC